MGVCSTLVTLIIAEMSNKLVRMTFSTSVSDPGPVVRIQIRLLFLSPDPDLDFKNPDTSIFCFSLSFLTNKRDLNDVL